MRWATALGANIAQSVLGSTRGIAHWSHKSFNDLGSTDGGLTRKTAPPSPTFGQLKAEGLRSGGQTLKALRVGVG